MLTLATDKNQGEVSQLKIPNQKCKKKKIFTMSQQQTRDSQYWRKAERTILLVFSPTVESYLTVANIPKTINLVEH